MSRILPGGRPGLVRALAAAATSAAVLAVSVAPAAAAPVDLRYTCDYPVVGPTPVTVTMREAVQDTAATGIPTQPGPIVLSTDPSAPPVPGADSAWMDGSGSLGVDVVLRAERPPNSTRRSG